MLPIGWHCVQRRGGSAVVRAPLSALLVYPRPASSLFGSPRRSSTDRGFPRLFYPRLSTLRPRNRPTSWRPTRSPTVPDPARPAAALALSQYRARLPTPLHATPSHLTPRHFVLPSLTRSLSVFLSSAPLFCFYLRVYVLRPTADTPLRYFYPASRCNTTVRIYFLPFRRDTAPRH